MLVIMPICVPTCYLSPCPVSTYCLSPPLSFVMLSLMVVRFSRPVFPEVLPFGFRALRMFWVSSFTFDYSALKSCIWGHILPATQLYLNGPSHDHVIIKPPPY